ncbi:unnamed protein product [Victoria cruziana]
MDETPGKMLSTLTVAEKPRSKPAGCVGIFFQLFDWNRRFARKKIFSNSFLLGARSKKASKMFGDDKLPMAKLLLIADENKGGFPEAKRSAADGNSSKLNENKRRSVRSPGIIGRLMGLETMPTSSCSEPASLAPQKLQTQRKASELLDDGQCPVHGNKMVECRPQKLQKTGIFESRSVIKSKKETFPFKNAVSRSRRHHQKLMTPVKSSGVLHGRNAVRLMEAATKILEPALLAPSRTQCAPLCSTKPQLAFEDTTAGEKYLGDLNDDIECLRAAIDDQESNGKPGVQKNEERLKHDVKNLADIVEVMGFDQKEHKWVVPDKKCNSQKLGRTNVKASAFSDVLRPNSRKQNQTFSKDRTDGHANEYCRRCSSCEASKESAVFMRNVNFLARSGSCGKEVKSRYSIDKGDDPLSRANVLHRRKIPVGGNSPTGIMGSAAHPNGRKGKLSITGSRTNASTDHLLSPTNLRMQRPKHTRYRESFPVHVRRHVDANANDENAVSFTFTSSVQPHLPVSPSQHGEENSQIELTCAACRTTSDPCNKFRINSQQKRCCNVKPRKVASQELKQLQGDSLSAILEKKLKELTCSDGIELSRLLSENCCMRTSVAPKGSTHLVLQDLISALTAKRSASEELQRASRLGNPDGYLAETEFSSTSDGMMNEAQSPQVVAQGLVYGKSFTGCPCENINDFGNLVGSDAKTKLSRCPLPNGSSHLSPVSILDASFSNESCFSPESNDGCGATQLRLSFADCSPWRMQQFGADMQLKVSATSWTNSDIGRGRIVIDCPHICGANEDSVGFQTEVTSGELEPFYVRKVLSSMQLTFENIALFGADPPQFSDLLLFQKLETVVDKHSKCKYIPDFLRSGEHHMRRSMFDFVMEYLALKFGRYGRSTYKALGKLSLSLNRERLSKEVYEEITKLRNLAGRVLDEIVEWDMNSSDGKWIGFEIEAFETALEIEKYILQSLIAEFTLDLSCSWVADDIYLSATRINFPC